jgi:aryl-alcohol dehydrogenase-like predicted oxidoreductase
MQYRKLGKTGVTISAISIGAMTYGSQIGEAESIKLIKAAMDEGINSFDTANGYGTSEEILGKALKGIRHNAFIATKVGAPLGPNAGPNDKGLSRRHIMQQIENSLNRLQTDYVDLYYCHMPDYNVPIEDTLNTLDDLVSQGKVRFIGCSNFYAWQLAKALGVSERYDLARFQCIESPYNLLTRDIEMELIPLCAKEGVGICAYNPLAGEILTGRHEFGKPPAEGRFTIQGFGKLYYDRYWSDVNFKAIDRFKELAQAHNYTLPQFSIAWLLNSPTLTSVLSGLISMEQLKENVVAADIKLTSEDIKACDEVWSMFRPTRYFYAKKE